MTPESPPIGGATRVFALLGDPVAHSLSPRIQNAALRAASLDGVYVALRCRPEEVPPLMRALARAGGGNVTVPHKETAAAAVDSPSDAVRRTGACNTFWLDGDRLAGDNTDVAGFDRALRSRIGDPRDADVLLLGAGGGAAAALVALLDGGAARVTIAARTPERAERLAGRMGDGVRERIALAAAAAGGRPPGQHTFDLVVNATPLGLTPGDALPVVPDPDRMRAVFDMVYAPGGTAWVRAAGAAGIPATDGTEMLLEQAAAAFERWWSRPAPLDAMRAALAAPVAPV